ncbi:MAG: GNAT family N-acetyltransferase, partial [Lachnospiraceae bacterium]|nr:GNAT family N-acetyltransferase [Lachnospiraceae bacterium]
LLSLDNKEDVMLYTNHEKCADMIDLLIIEPLRNCGVGSRLALACEEYCKEMAIPYLGLDVNPTDNFAAKRLYERLGYRAVGEIHLDGVYEYTDEQGNQGKYEDWCIDMIKRM